MLSQNGFNRNPEKWQKINQYNIKKDTTQEGVIENESVSVCSLCDAQRAREGEGKIEGEMRLKNERCHQKW